jgi:hypothetical protein
MIAKVAWFARGRIDIGEILGGFPDSVFMTYHYNGRNSSFTPNQDLQNGACQVKDLLDGFSCGLVGLGANLCRVVSTASSAGSSTATPAPVLASQTLV